jgi:peptide/nickel transport system substrate-binding protein
LQPSRIVYEPLGDFDKDGNLVPVLAAEIPSVENGQLDADNKYVTWKLRQDVLWSDGKPFTAADVVFTYSYIIDPDVNVVTKSEYGQVASVEALDDYTVKVTFKDVNPAWALSFVGIRGVILPKHIFEPTMGAKAREARVNTIPVGTGPYRVKEPTDPTESGIKPQEVLLLGSQVVKTTKIEFEPNPYYRFPEKIAFRKVIWRGGGDTVEANRQLFEEGSLHVSYSVNPSLASADSKGEILYTPRTGTRRILLNFTDPYKLADDEYSSRSTSHPLLSNKVVRQAIAYAIDRQPLIDQVYTTGVPAYAILVAPPQYLSKEEFYKYDPAKANALLDEAGYVDTDGDTFREKDGIKMKLLFQSFVGATTQTAQGLIKENLKAIGIDVEIKTTESGIMFGNDTTNPDHASHFNADLMMFQTQSNSFDPTSFMEFWTCDQIPQKANGWKGNNNERWCNPAYDELLQKTKTEPNPELRQDMFVKLNNMLVEDVATIPLVWEKNMLGINKNLEGLDPTPWDMLTWNIQDWYFSKP